MEINKELAGKYNWDMKWDTRAKIIAAALPNRVSILDLGGGKGNLFGFLKDRKYYLKNPDNYVSLDLEKWTDRTTIADFNKGEFPDVGKFDYLIAQGVLEYINDPLDFFQKIRRYGDLLIFTYLETKEIPNRPKRNYFSQKEICDWLKKADWKILFYRKGPQSFFYCSK